MTIGEQLYLALVLLAFCTFGATLAAVSSSTSSHLRKGEKKAAEQSHLKKAA
jgi:hypothetical protein